METVSLYQFREIFSRCNFAADNFYLTPANFISIQSNNYQGVFLPEKLAVAVLETNIRIRTASFDLTLNFDGINSHLTVF